MLLNTKEKFRKTFLSTLIVSSLSIPTLAVAADITLNPIDKTQETGEPVGYEPTDKNTVITNDVKIDITADENKHGKTRPKGIIVRGDKTLDIKGKTNVDVTFVNENFLDLASADTNAAYGIAVGYDWRGGAPTDTAKLTLHDDAEINVDNGPDTRPLFGHQLSGVRIFQKNGAVPIFNSKKKLTINVKDKTTAKNGSYLVGIYINGNGAEANLKDSEITIKANGTSSAAIKIGKPGDNKPADYKGAVVNSTGKMVLDTTATKDSAAVRLFGTKSRLIADSDTSSGEIKSGSSAIVFDTMDLLLRGEEYREQEVRLNNTKITTNSDNASLIVAQENLETAKDGDAKFLLKGKDSEAKAAKNGWLVEAKAGQLRTSNLSVAIDNQAKVIGLMHQGSNANEHSKLDVKLDNQATWELAQKEDEAEQRSTINALTLNNGSVLDASKHIPTGAAGTDYKVKLVKQDGSDGTLTNNNSEITLANGSYGDKLTVEGNYTANNGVLKMNTQWNTNDPNNGKSDLLEVTGNVEGVTKVVSLKANGAENLVDGSIGSIASDLGKNSTAVIRVQGTSNLHNFTGLTRTTGAGELQLASKRVGNATEYFWTVTSTNGGAIYVSSVPGYTLAPKLNLEVGYETVGTLHQRRGENQALSWEKSQANNQTWGRIIGKHLALDGKERLNLTANLSGFQFGHDFDVASTENGGKRFTGIYAGYTHANSKFYDEYRAENGVVLNDKYTGKAKTENFHAGVTHTRYAENGSYLDLVGQLSWVKNKYYALDSQAKNHGFGVALSSEVGHPFALGKEKMNNGDSWIIEPQAQLIYQYLGLSRFNDELRSVHQDKQHGLRGRVGARLAYNDLTAREKVRTLYFTANLWHDFKNTAGSNIGADNINEKFAKTWGEFGVGTQLATSANSHIYADVRYEHSLSGAKRQGYKGSVGIKYSW